jgi:hypothetical protein
MPRFIITDDGMIPDWRSDVHAAAPAEKEFPIIFEIDDHDSFISGLFDKKDGTDAVYVKHL